MTQHKISKLTRNDEMSNYIIQKDVVQTIILPAMNVNYMTVTFVKILSYIVEITFTYHN